MNDAPFADPAPATCGALSPPIIGVHHCDREQGHGGPHRRNGPRTEAPVGWHQWSVDWRDPTS